MASMKSFNNTFIMAIALFAVVACVPKATEKKAICKANEAFNTVSRSCYSITESRVKPVGTKSTDTLSEETPKLVSLTYTDGNKDQALTCQVSGISSNVEVISPLVSSGGLFTKADEVSLAVIAAANAIPAPDDVAALAASTAMQAALLVAKNSSYYPTVMTQIGVFKTQANVILSLAATYTAMSTVQYYYTLSQQRMLELTPMLTMATNRCECTAGVCSTMVVPKLNKSGAAGFSYTVTDVDGESATKAVSLTITAMSAATSHLRPVAESSYEVLAESNTSVPTSYAITLPGAADLAGTAPSVFRYYFNGSKNGSNQGLTSLGKVSGCMDLTGSTGLTDTSCLYTPDSGDTFDAITVATATVTIGDLIFDALAAGTSGNSITIKYYSTLANNLAADPYLTDTELFGLVNPAYNESFVRVVGDEIRVFINPGVTTSNDIRDLINTHVQAQKMVVVSGGSGAFPVPSALTPSSVALAGGVDAFDKIPYLANNLSTSSVNNASVMVKIQTVDDVPAMNFVASAASTYLEDTNPVVINLSSTYSDVDTDGAIYSNVCNVDPLDAVFLANFSVTSCTCVVAVCTLTVVPNANVSSTTAFPFSYRIGSTDGITTNYTAYRTYSLTMTPINDAPELSSVALPTITAIPDATILEGGSGFVDVWIDPGGSGFETSQTLTLTAASSNTTILPDANIVIGELPTPVVGKKRITYTPAANQSGVLNITVTLKDNGGVANSGSDTTTDVFALTVTFVDNAPTFISSITSIATNEGGAVQSDGFQIDEDAGSSADENAQGMRISAITTDNATVLPTTAISIFYDLNDNGVLDTGEARAVGAVLENAAADDVKLHKFYLKLDPVDGVAGNANVILTISDGTNTATTNFSFIVHSIASLHGGWSNISSSGIKTNKLGAPVSESEIECNYNTSTDAENCSGLACTGTSSPHSTITPDAANVIYWDSSNKRCYRSTSTSQFSWVDFNTSCPVTKKTGVCSDNNCITGDAAPAPLNATIPSEVGLYYYNTNNSTCYVSTGKAANTEWEVYVPTKVTLEWKPFIIVGSGPNSGVQIAGWNVYRREAGADYDFKGGHLKNASSTTTYTITDPNVRTFTDTTAIAGKVYYYIVRPVDNIRSFPTYTQEIFSEVRVLASPANYAFVHRWMVNQEICNGMNLTNETTPYHVDQTKNFRCEYNGPGESTTTPGYYDYGRDLLVDSQELGCPYAAAPKCTGNGCVGIGAPSATAGIAADDLYYDRSAGTCYRYDGAAWQTFDTAFALTSALASSLNTALNAPLVNITEPRAEVVCSSRLAPTGTDVTFSSANAILPSKKDYNAYASHPLSLSDSQISDLEQGFSLNVESRCNSSSASGLVTAYTDSAIPSTSFIYSLPGTASSGIRSIYTGSVPWSSSKGSESCVSRFGIQDLYGNVAEWTTDKMECSAANAICTADATASFAAYDFDTVVAGVDAYAFDLRSGPFNDSDTSTVGPSASDTYLTEWLFADELFSAGKFSYPIGLPINSDIDTVSAYQGMPALTWILDIGPSSGITTNKLHEDAAIINASAVNAIAAPKVGAFAVGGSYLSGSKAGRFNMELLNRLISRADVGMRCIIPINSTTDYPVDTAHVYPY